jgi:hypothetical protein
VRFWSYFICKRHKYVAQIRRKVNFYVLLWQFRWCFWIWYQLRTFNTPNPTYFTSIYTHLPNKYVILEPNFPWIPMYHIWQIVTRNFKLGYLRDFVEYFSHPGCIGKRKRCTLMPCIDTYWSRGVGGVIFGPEGLLPSQNLQGSARRPRQGSKHR